MNSAGIFPLQPVVSLVSLALATLSLTSAPSLAAPNRVQSRPSGQAVVVPTLPVGTSIVVPTIPVGRPLPNPWEPVSWPTSPPAIVQPIAPPSPPPTVQPISTTLPLPVPARSREIRGVWMTNVDSGVLYDRGQLADAISELSRLNFNTIYPVVWNWGYTQYPSRVAERVLGSRVDPRPEAVGLQGRDMLAEIVQQGKSRGLAIIPWLEFGFMAPDDSTLARIRPDWLTKRLDGSQVWMEGDHARVWLNPFNPEVQDFILQLALELVTQYNVDGIQLDDHFGLPVEFGYDTYTLLLYQQETGQLPPNNPKDPAWMRWRADKITAFMNRLVREVKARKPNAIISLSPNAFPYAYEASLQDWPTWQRQGWLDEVIVQIYRDSLESFNAELSRPALQEANQRIPTAIGILAGLRGKAVSMQQVQAQVSAVRSRGFSGVSLFFYETVWNLTNESPHDRKAGFQTLFTPKAPRVDRQNWSAVGKN